MAVSEKNINKFISKWQGRGKEKQDDQAYWTDLLSYIFELTDITSRIEPQKDVIGPDGNTKWIDIYIPETKVLIEQKSLNINLAKPQAGHDGMTPYEQAKMYNDSLRLSEKARWIVTSNFAEIWIYDMESKKPEDSVTIVKLDNLVREYKQLRFLYDPQVEQIKREFEISKEAGEEIGKIYDALIKQYPENPSVDDLKNLNTFCVRIVFCYYAEDAGLFEENLFSNYIKSFNPQHLRNGLKELFRILNTPDTERDPFEEPSLLKFPYVNGGLFDGKNNIIPQFDVSTQRILIEAADFNWNDISPTIFGAIFESTLNQETRRNNGMHYTAVENIHKVIDPLFLNDLKSELEEIKASKQPNVKVQKLRSFQEKLASLTFFDPACGSGNFLTETYLSLRKLENEAIEQLSSSLMITAASDTLIRVHLQQFYGIEINDFAVSVAKTALWIAENQMMKKTKELIINADTLNFLPLKSFTNIKEGNALRIDWNDVIPANKCNYIMGNPPFVGKKYQSKEQKDDMKNLFGSKFNGLGNLDYVSSWYKKACDYMMDNHKIRTAFVSTNSVVQGEHIPYLWAQLYASYPIEIYFAYQSFRWDSEAQIKAHVHCVIIGFSFESIKPKTLYTSAATENVSIIHPYLVEMPLIFIKVRSNPICNVNSLVYGSFALDDGNYTISEDEYNEIIKKEPQIKPYLKLFIGSEEFINDKKRYCVWLKNADISDIRKSKILMQKIENVKKWRLSSSRPGTLKVANTPMLFAEDRQPSSAYLAIPLTSSEKREYIPMGYMTEEIIASNHLTVLPNATLYDFGILTSSVHMAWMRRVAGRLETRYNYSAKVVYNNFPWCNPTQEQKEKIEQAAKAILDARALYPNNSLADLYDSLTMPSELRKAHLENDKAVMKAYGFSPDMDEDLIVLELMKMYQKTVGEK
ncbi:MAG: class I SAM-dependent DNA methyltransferase [Butyrivibrio sp.]|nr:class I SAM-dependent DNA methyltransferase [Butyrivibrio sp.]